jgi:heme oxygenase
MHDGGGQNRTATVDAPRHLRVECSQEIHGEIRDGFIGMLLTRLRDGTATLHDRVERAVDLSSRLRSKAAYASLLGRFLGFYAPLEVRLAEIVGDAPVPLDLVARRKADWLRSDLAVCGYSAGEIEGLPVCGRLPSLEGFPEVFGCLYVLEGATLGGQVVSREVERFHGWNADAGCSFFASYRTRVRAMWQEFCIVLDAYASSGPGRDDGIVSAAVETFERFEEWIAGETGCYGEPRR